MMERTDTFTGDEKYGRQVKKEFLTRSEYLIQYLGNKRGDKNDQK